METSKSCYKPLPAALPKVWVLQYCSAGASITKLQTQEHKIDCFFSLSRIKTFLATMSSIHFTLLFFWLTQGKVHSKLLERCVKSMYITF